MSDISLITLSNYVRPKLIENKSKNWVLNGRNNEFYQYTIDRFNGSPTNAAVINSYVSLIYGKGLQAKNVNVNLDAWTKLKTILSAKDLKRIISDFELFGEASMEVIETRGKELSSIKHVPKNFVVPELVNEDGEIEGYWFSRDWTKSSQQQYIPVNIPAFGMKSAKTMYVIKPYQAGKEYFADPDYLAGMPYAEMEEEIANLNINSIKNGLSAGYIISVPDGKSMSTEQRKDMDRDLKTKVSGSPEANRYILDFRGRDTEAMTVEAFPVNENIHKQWQFLTSESRQQILTAHRVTSPMLFGIKDNTGLGNNADELQESAIMLQQTVIMPKQQFILDALEEILSQYDINLDLFFLPLLDAPKEEEVKTQLSHDHSVNDLINLGEDEDLENYYIFDEQEVDYDTDDQVHMSLASTGVARPNSKSTQDSDSIKIRYRYVGNDVPQREFCQKMMFAKKIYRKEDVLQMSEKAVNPGWGANGASTYSIWLYKGGGNCYHKWNRVIYVKQGVDVDVNSPLAKTISTTKARSQGEKVPTNDSRVSIAPINMPNNGFLTK